MICQEGVVSVILLMFQLLLRIKGLEMPTYNYSCKNCNNEFSVFQGINDAHVDKCTICGSKKIERLITGGTGMIFKGDGFYLTDYTDYGKKDKKNIDKNNKGKNNDSKSKESN